MQVHVGREIRVSELKQEDVSIALRLADFYLHSLNLSKIICSVVN